MLKKIDLFGQPVIFKFDGSEKSKSSIGGWFSLLLFAFVIWTVYIAGEDIIYRQNPKIIMSETFSENPKPMVLTDETFSFAVGLQAPITYAHYINESIYTLEAQYTRQIREVDENGIVQIKAEYPSLTLERCRKEHFGIHGSKFENLELNDMHCLKKEQPGFDKLILQGTFESPIFQDIEIIVKPCDSETSRVACAPKEKIDEMLGSCYFAIYYTNIAIDAKNATNPSFIFRDSYYTTVSNSLFKDIPFWLSHIELKSDFGWLITDEKIEKFVKVGIVGESVTLLQKNQKRMLNLRIRMDKITTQYERSYLKIGDILASVNGFAAAGLIGIFLLIGRYSKIKFYEKLINELFDLKMLNKSKTQSKISKTLQDLNKNDDTDSNLEGKKVELTQHRKPNKSKTSVNLEKSLRFNYSDEKDIEKSEISMTSLWKLDKGKRTNDADDKDSTMKIEKLKHGGLPEILEEQSPQSPAEKYLLDSSIISMHSPKRKLPEPLFLREKPQMSDMRPKIKILETYEPSSPGESLAMLGSLIIEKRDATWTKLREFGQNKSTEKGEKHKKEVKTLVITNEASDAKDFHMYQLHDENNDEELDKKAELLSSNLNKGSEKLNISFKEYIMSYFWKSNSLKEKLSLLNEGIRRIEERIDIFNVLKKFREVDKLKLLLLESEQLVLFDTLPKPELLFNGLQRKNTWFRKFKDTKFITEQKKKDLIFISYKNLKKKPEKTMIDKKLLEIYDDI